MRDLFKCLGGNKNIGPRRVEGGRGEASFWSAVAFYEAFPPPPLGLAPLLHFHCILSRNRHSPCRRLTEALPAGSRGDGILQGARGGQQRGRGSAGGSPVPQAPPLGGAGSRSRDATQAGATRGAAAGSHRATPPPRRRRPHPAARAPAPRRRRGRRPGVMNGRSGSTAPPGRDARPMAARAAWMDEVSAVVSGMECVSVTFRTG